MHLSIIQYLIPQLVLTWLTYEVETNKSDLAREMRHRVYAYPRSLNVLGRPPLVHTQIVSQGQCKSSDSICQADYI